MGQGTIGAPARLCRVEDWPARLAGFLRERRSLPYAYGTNDCCTFVRDSVRAITGIDLMPGLRPPTTRRAGARFLLAGGYGDVEGLATRVLGAPLASPKLAGRGDIVSFWADDEMHLAVVAGLEAATPAQEGLAWVPRTLWRSGWKVG
jgi:hypothetical protein